MCLGGLSPSSPRIFATEFLVSSDLPCLSRRGSTADRLVSNRKVCDWVRLSAGSSGGLLGLEVLVGKEGSGTTEDNDGVEADAETGGSASLSSGSERAGKGSLGLGVTGLFVEKGKRSVETV